MGGAAIPQENELVLDVLQIPGAAFAVNASQQIVAWNDAAERLLGYSADDVLGALCSGVLTAAPSAACHECRYRCVAMANARRARAVPTLETPVKASDGSQKWIMLSVLVAHTSVGQMRVIHLMHDVTEYHRLSAGVGRVASKRIPALAPTAVGQSIGVTEAGARQASLGSADASALPAALRIEQTIAPAKATPTKAQPGQATLTPREHEVLRLLACGLATDEIAQTLSISRLTARNHVNKVLEKLGVSSRLQAVVVASQRNLI